MNGSAAALSANTMDFLKEFQKHSFVRLVATHRHTHNCDGLNAARRQVTAYRPLNSPPRPLAFPAAAPRSPPDPRPHRGAIYVTVLEELVRSVAGEGRRLLAPLVHHQLGGPEDVGIIDLC